jgi:capsular polysaccharide biosynthesis protein
MNRYFAEFDCLCLSACRTAGIDVFWSDPECTHAIAPLLYVSRLAAGRDRRGYRWWVNEEAVVEALASLVFTIFEPEMHPIEEQIATFRSATLIVGPSGTGMFNTVFAWQGTRILSLEPQQDWIWQHANMFAGRGHYFGFRRRRCRL